MLSAVRNALPIALRVCDDPEHVIPAEGSGRFALCKTDREFVASVESSRVARLVWEPAASPGYRHEILAALAGAPHPVPLLLRTRLSVTGEASLAIDVARIAADLTVSCSHGERLAAALDNWGGPGEQTPVRRILQGLPVLSPACEVALLALVLPGRHEPIATAAQRCRWSQRKLESCLLEARLPTPSTLRGWSVALHTSWRLEMLGRSSKQAAIAGGFSDACALGNYIRRHVGLRPRSMNQRGMFADILDRFYALIRASGARPALFDESRRG